MATHYVLIDYENVQPAALKLVDAEHVKVMLFLGASQSKLPFELVAAMQAFGTRAEYVKVSGNGSNALDFHVAYYIGHLAALEPTAHFHVISKDTGFDPLIQHLKARDLSVTRTASIEAIVPASMASTKTSKGLPDRVSTAVANLQQRGTSKPRTVKTLSSTLASVFQKKLDDAEIAELVTELTRRGIVVVTQNKVSYALDQVQA